MARRAAAGAQTLASPVYPPERVVDTLGAGEFNNVGVKIEHRNTAH